MTKAKVKDETIEKIVYSGCNSKVVYREFCKLNDVPVKVYISTDFCNNFGGTISVLSKDTLKWETIYSIPNAFLEVRNSSESSYYVKEKELKAQKDDYIEIFENDTNNLKAKLIELLF